MSTLIAERRLLTDEWTDDVVAMLGAIRGFTTTRALHNGCRVVLFELAGERELHVNVTHQCRTATARGWSGPGVTPDGFVHNRRFDGMQPKLIVRHIREMVFAAPDGAAVRPPVRRGGAA
jgi:hypothetical protein